MVICWCTAHGDCVGGYFFEWGELKKMVAVACEVLNNLGVIVDKPADRSRKVNNLAPELRPIHLRLERWGKYCYDYGIAGYPAQSPTEKAALYGKLGIPQHVNYRPEAAMPIELMPIDAAIARLGDVDRRAITVYYSTWTTPEVQCRKLHMRVRQFQNVLNRARWRILGYVEALEQK